MEKKMTTMIAAVAVVAVVLVAGAFVILNNDDDGTKNAAIASQLQIRGNANDDYTIDGKDLDIVNDVIAGTKTLAEYPLADVNNDGVVNDADVSLLKDLIDRKDGTTVYVVCLDRNGDSTTVPVTYPLRNVVPYGTNMQLPTLYANGGQYVVGYFVSSYTTAEASISSTARDLEGSQRSISDAAWSNFTALDASISGGLGAILVDYSGITQITEKRMGDLNDAGIPMICYESADATAEITTVLTLGFLFGGECETMGVKYAQTAWNLIKEINDKLKDVKDEDKTSYICCTMYIYICGASSSFNTSATTAGGVAYASLNSDFNSIYTKNSTKMTSVEALSKFTDVDVIINNRSMDWGLTAEEIKGLVIDTWDHNNSGKSSTEYFAKFLDKLVYIDNLLPGAVKLAYMAHAMYGDTFSREWADGVLQDYIDMGTLPLKGQTLDTVLAYIDLSTYNAVKA